MVSSFVLSHTTVGAAMAGAPLLQRARRADTFVMAYPGAYPGAPGGYGQPYPQQGGYAYGYAQPGAPAQPKQPQSAVPDQQAQAMQMAELRRQFDSVDKNRTGNISANELMNISFSGTKLSLETSRKLVKLFDRHGHGQICA